MDYALKIDSFIDKIVLNFDHENEMIKSIIEKLKKMYYYENLVIGDNYLEIRNKYFTRRIIVDLNDRHIELIEKGNKKDDLKITDFFHDTYYKIDNGNGKIYKINHETITNKNVETTVKTAIVYDYIKGKNTSTHSKLEETTKTQDIRTGTTSEKIKTLDKTFYNFPNGTTLKCLDERGKKTFFKQTGFGEGVKPLEINELEFMKILKANYRSIKPPVKTK